MLYAPSCLCVCSSRGGLAQVGRTCRAAWARVSRFLRAVAPLTTLLERVRLVLFAESLGGTESLVTYPLVQTHGSIPGPMLDKLGIDERLLRLSVGLESAEDLIADLERAIG